MSTTTKFIRASLVKHLHWTSKTGSRRQIAGGHFGPLYLPRGSRRGTLLSLDIVLATLGIKEQDLAPAIARFNAAHSQPSRTPIIELDPSQVTQVRP